MSGLRQGEDHLVSEAKDSSVHVEGHYVGRFIGFLFLADEVAGADDAKALKKAAEKALQMVLEDRVKEFGAAETGISLSVAEGIDKPSICWQGDLVARIVKGNTRFTPRISLPVNTVLSGPQAEAVAAKCESWLAAHMEKHIWPLKRLDDELTGGAIAEDASPLGGLARGIAFQLVEHFGVLAREKVADELREVVQEARKGLRRHRVRIGASNLFIPLLLKPAATELRLLLWSLWDGAGALPAQPVPGMVWTDMAAGVPGDFYRIAGFHPTRSKAVRVDMLERLADSVRPLGAGGKAFEVSPDIMGLVGLSSGDFAAAMQAIGYSARTRKMPPQAPAQVKEEAPAEAEEAAPATVKEGAPAEAEEAAATAADKAEAKPEVEEATDRIPDKAVEPAPEAVAESEWVEKTFFRWAPEGERRPAAKNRGKGSLGNKRRDGDGKRKAAPRPARPAKKPAAHQEVDPDSPFAALADLKKNMKAKGS